MTPALFWTLAGVALVVGLCTTGARWLRSRRHDRPARDRAGRLGELAAGWRDRIVPSRPVSLQSWPEALVEAATRTARAVPGGLVPASSYRVRCGGALYATAAPHVGALRTEFVRLLGECLPAFAGPEPARIAFVYDESLQPEAYRMDAEYPEDSPATANHGTVVHVAPVLQGGRPDPEVPELADWTVTVPGGAEWTLWARGETTFGSEPGCDVVLDDPFVSARHLRAAVDGDALVLRDGGIGTGPDGRDRVRHSTNHTFLREHPIAVATVPPGDGPVVVRLGPRCTVEFRHVPSVVTEVVRPGAR